MEQHRTASVRRRALKIYWGVLRSRVLRGRWLSPLLDQGGDRCGPARVERPVPRALEEARGDQPQRARPRRFRDPLSPRRPFPCSGPVAEPAPCGSALPVPPRTGPPPWSPGTLGDKPRRHMSFQSRTSGDGRRTLVEAARTRVSPPSATVAQRWRTCLLRNAASGGWIRAAEPVMPRWVRGVDVIRRFVYSMEERADSRKGRVAARQHNALALSRDTPVEMR
jgi:hypothetical protein